MAFKVNSGAKMSNIQTYSSKTKSFDPTKNTYQYHDYDFDLDKMLEDAKNNFIEVENRNRMLKELAEKRAAERAAIRKAQKEAEERAKKEAEERAKKMAELESLYQARDDNNGFFHPNKEEEIENAILKLEKELGTPHKPDGWEKFSDTVESVGATVVVGATSVVSGGVDLVESAVDGVIWAGGTCVSGVAEGLDFLGVEGAGDFAKSVENWTMDTIAYDVTGELNKAFYENTSVGQAINDASYMKYDSELAQGIQNFTSDAVLAVGATAATVATGGAAAPLFVVGFAAGAGESAEKKFQDTENRDFWGSAGEIALDGTIKGVSTVATGKAGASLYNGVKTLHSIGFDGAKAVAKSTFNKFGKEVMVNTIKDNGKNMLKNAAISTLKEGEFYLETGAMIADNVKTGIQTGEWDVLGMVGDAAYIYGSNFVGNLGGEYFNMAGQANNAGKACHDATNNFKKDNWISKNVSDSDFDETVEQAISLARQYEVDGVMSQETFYEVWGAPKGQKPDPTTYLSQDYINKHLSNFEDGVGRLNTPSEVDFQNAAFGFDANGRQTGNGGFVGYRNQYNVGTTTYSNGSEFVSPKATVNNLENTVGTMSDIFDKSKFLSDSLKVPDGKFDAGVGRYDIDSDTVKNLNLRMASGNEPGAYYMDWMPGGKTAGGQFEAIVDMFPTGGSGVTYTTIY